MGRHSTGATTTKESRRIELSYLLKSGLLQKDRIVNSVMGWTDNSQVSIMTSYTLDEKYIRLCYTRTESAGEKISYDYKIYLTSIESNLGKGEVLYFLCPETHQPCRILYQSYGYPKWKSREAYRNRIYYSSQTTSKRYYSLDRSFKLEDRLEAIYTKGFKETYKGKETRISKRVRKLLVQQDYHENQKFMGLSLFLNKIKAQ